MLMKNRYIALQVTFEGEDEQLTEDQKAAAAAGDEIKVPEGFTADQQKKFNDAVAAERRKQEQKYRKELEKAETTYKDMLSNSKSLTEKERQTLQDNLETVQGQLRSKEAQLTEEKKQLEANYQQKLTELMSRAETAESRYKNSTIDRALQDAAVKHDAHNPEQIVMLLRNNTKLVESVDEKTGKPTGQFKVMVEFKDKDSTTGQEVLMSKSPEEAVKRMTEIAESKNLFKKNVVSGIGGNSAIGGLSPGSNGRIDPRTLTPEQHAKIRAENPELLGLRAKSARR